jgi:hypothetical protein
VCAWKYHAFSLLFLAIIFCKKMRHRALMRVRRWCTPIPLSSSLPYSKLECFRCLPCYMNFTISLFIVSINVVGGGVEYG